MLYCASENLSVIINDVKSKKKEACMRNAAFLIKSVNCKVMGPKNSF